MYDINWDMFNIKNNDRTTAFETMCRHIFMRKFSIDGYNFQSNYNQTGLETQPIKYENEWYGFQCKYSDSNNNDALYREVYKSLIKAYRIFPDTLDHIYIFTNADIQPNCTKEELKDMEKSTYRIKISREAMKRNVELHWIKKENFASILNDTTNLDIYKLYFSSERELSFMDDSISIEDRTFLKSDSFLDLSLNNIKFNDKYNEILNNKLSIILGNAGTGKTEILKKMYITCSERFLGNYKDDFGTVGDIPVYIRLRECILGNLEDLLRQRLLDYDINISDIKYKFIYFFDGLDEVSNKHIDKVISYISILNKRENTKSIILSSRNNSVNLPFLYRSVTQNKYIINKTKTEIIDLYFEKRQDTRKLESYRTIKPSIKNLLNEIDDIFSIKLLWQTIDEINEDTTKIELIEKSINYLTTNYTKIHLLQLPEIKHQNIENLNTEIAYYLQTNDTLNISLSKLQDIISKKYPKLSYLDIDEVIFCLAEMFFDVAENEKSQYIYSFKHRRYQEYFLYKKINNVFFEDPFILRELNLLTNKDFILNIFLKQSLKDSIKDKDILKILSLRFLEAYLGEEYWRNYKDSLIGLRYGYGVGGESYLDSKCLIDSLAIKNSEELIILLENEALSIKGFLSTKNYWTFIEKHYLFNKYDIREVLAKHHSLTDEFIKDSIYENPCAYWRVKCEIDGVNPKEIYDECIKDIEINDWNLDYIDSRLYENLNLVVEFFKMALEIRPSIINELVETINVGHLEIICYELLRDDKMFYLFSKGTEIKELRENIILRIENNPDEEFKINALVLFNILSTNEVIGRNLLEERFKKVNANHHMTWKTNIELNSYITNLLSRQNELYSIDCKLGVNIRKIIKDHFFGDKDEILNLLIDEIKQYNFICDNWFQYDNSKLIGSIVASLDFSNESLKSFLHRLFKYQDVISVTVVLYTILIDNPKLFFSIANVVMLNELHAGFSSQLSYYDSNSETEFMFSAMISKFDASESNRLLIRGLNNSIYRPAFRNEDLVSYVLPKCLLIAVQNHLFGKNELESLSYRIFDMLQIMGDTTDSGDRRSYFKYVLETHITDSLILDELYDISSDDALPYNSTISNIVDFNKIDKENIKDYYKCKIENLNYKNLNFWERLINLGKSFDKDLLPLFEILKEYKYPEFYFGGPSEYFPVITAVLLSDNNLRNCTIEFIIEQGGRLGLLNMIKTFSYTGNSEEMKKYIIQLFKLIEALVYPNKAHHIAHQYKDTEVSRVLNVVYASSEDDWIKRESQLDLIYKDDTRIKIMWDDTETKFYDDWAVEHSDTEAFKVNYYISYNGTIIKEFPLVYVDRYRALLPIPKSGTNIIPYKKYKIALLVGDGTTLNSYIGSSGLIVE